MIAAAILHPFHKAVGIEVRVVNGVKRSEPDIPNALSQVKRIVSKIKANRHCKEMALLPKQRVF